MSAAVIPYRLRPNKFIDRELFTDLLTHIVPQRGLGKYVYASMGGQHLVDHFSVYRRTGILNLFSFDNDENVVERQKFNRPNDMVVCKKMHTSQFAGEMDKVFEGFPDAKNMIVWLDYTDPHGRLSQLQELTDVASRLQPGDIVRITLNAAVATLDENADSGAWKKIGAPSPGEYRRDRLKNQIGQFLPEELKAVGQLEFPNVLARCVAMALSKAADSSSQEIDFLPILLTTYKDGQRMMTATALVTGKPDHPTVVDSGTWHLLPEHWGDLLEIQAPDLSMREKLTLDERLSSEPVAIADTLGFELSKTRDKSLKAIMSYQRFHRYYPSFHNIDS